MSVYGCVKHSTCNLGCPVLPSADLFLTGKNDHVLSYEKQNLHAEILTYLFFSAKIFGTPLRYRITEPFPSEYLSAGFKLKMSTKLRFSIGNIIELTL